jgi:tetratricopeptide (TPR) repeat protein
MEAAMKKTTILVLSLALLVSVLSAQVYLGGRGRLTGLVMDQKGQPIEGVTVKLFAVKHQGGFSVETGKEGKWAATMLSGGEWNLDFEKMGYAPFRTSVTVKELERLPEIKVVLQKVEGLVLSDELKKALGEANQLFEKKDYAGALEGYNAIMTKYPDAYIIWQNIGNCHFAQEQYDKAEEAYRKVLAKSPTDTSALVAVGNCYFNRNQTEQALEWYAKVDFSKIADPTVLYNIGLNLFGSAKYDEALKYFQRSVEVQKDFEDGYYQMGLTFVSMQKTTEAIAVFEQFMKQFPESPKTDQVKGFLEYLKKK